MHVIVAFSADYGSRPNPAVGDAFWLVASPSNRTLAEKAWQSKAVDPDSAVFDATADPVDDSGVLEQFDTVDLHHPYWTKIDLIGVRLNDYLDQEFRKRGFVATESTDGFGLVRSDHLPSSPSSDRQQADWGSRAA